MDQAVKATVATMPMPEPVMVIIVTPTLPPATTANPHSSPEAVARAWVEAIVARDCDRAAEMPTSPMLSCLKGQARLTPWPACLPAHDRHAKDEEETCGLSPKIADKHRPTALG